MNSIILATLLCGQPIFFQEVVIESRDVVWCFRRESSDGESWGEWIQKPPFDNSKNYQIWKPVKIKQELASKVLGSSMTKWLNDRPRVSGYYNFTNYQKYDNKIADNYGTYTKERITFKVYQPR